MKSIEGGPELVAVLIGGAFLTLFSFWIMKDDEIPLPVVGVFAIGAVTGAAVQAGVRILGVS